MVLSCTLADARCHQNPGLMLKSETSMWQVTPPTGPSEEQPQGRDTKLGFKNSHILQFLH